MYAELRDRFIQADRPFTEGAVDVFQQRFTVGEVKTASLAITALGVYEAELNGKKVGDILFAPGYTYYHRQLQAQTYGIPGVGEGDLLALSPSFEVVHVFEKAPLVQGNHKGHK